MSSFNQTLQLKESRVLDFIQSKFGQLPTTIRNPADISAEYHKIYFFSIDQQNYVLRVSRPAFPIIKTKNEVACMKWIKQICPSCRVPDVVLWSADTEELGYEYVVLTKCVGRNINDIWEELTEENVTEIIDQVAHLFKTCIQYPFNQVGGLTIDDNGEIKVGPVIEEVCYEIEHIEKYWKDYFGNEQEKNKLFYKLQVGGPFNSMINYIRASLERDLYVLNTHDNCDDLSKTLGPAMSRLLDSFTPTVVEAVNCSKRKLILAHQDLHLGNLLWDDNNKTLGGILDWEFSGVTAVDQWIRRNTLSSTNRTAMTRYIELQDRLRQAVILKHAGVTGSLAVESIKKILNDIISYTFWIVHCTVTATQQQDRLTWMGGFSDMLDKFYAITKRNIVHVRYY